MTRDELRPFLDRSVALYVSGSEALTGVLTMPDAAQPDRYAVVSRDGESDPIFVDAASIERIEA